MSQSVIILGGGIIGLSCAYEAAKRNYKVTLIEPGLLGGQASGAAAGMLAPYSEQLEQPDAFFQLCRQSLLMYERWTQEIEQLSKRSVGLINCGSLYVCKHEADIQPLLTRLLWQNEWQAGMEQLEREELLQLEPQLSKDIVAGLYSPAESHVDAPQLVRALIACCQMLRVRLIEQAGAIEAVEQTDAGITVKYAAELKSIRAERLIVCSGAWTSLYESSFNLALPVHPIRGQICAYKNNAVTPAHLIFSAHAYWVMKTDGRLICGASEDVAGYNTETTEQGIGRLVRASENWLPALKRQKLFSSWAGLRPATKDGLPLIGPIDRTGRIIIAAGHYRNGILLSPVTALIAADLLDNYLSSSISPFHPARFTRAAI
ncbi:glycine oxidase ThiO [Paenibacillus sp. IITD108]|uniref:glycine oxidase ThiO n=1 Tax=Paenibacillus sp. IITD108 TaxID=3116649 RepID=UPI002F40B656